MSLTQKRLLIVAGLIVLGIVLGRLGFHVFLDFMLGGTLFGGNILCVAGVLVADYAGRNVVWGQYSMSNEQKKTKKKGRVCGSSSIFSHLLLLLLAVLPANPSHHRG